MYACVSKGSDQGENKEHRRLVLSVQSRNVVKLYYAFVRPVFYTYLQVKIHVTMSNLTAKHRRYNV